MKKMRNEERLEASAMANELDVINWKAAGRVQRVDAVGAGRCMVPIRKVHFGGEQFGYRMELLRIDSRCDGSLRRTFTPRDVLDLPKLAQVLAATLVADGCLSEELKADLDCLAATLDIVVGPAGQLGTDRWCVVPREALQVIVDYLWHDEKKHFEETEASEREGHVFRSLVGLRRAMD
jgi:hypothetical protein